MSPHTQSENQLIKSLSTHRERGLSPASMQRSIERWGKNTVAEKKSKTLFNRVIGALFEPMMVIMLVAFAITLGVNIGKVLGGKPGDFYECLGIAVAIGVSVSLTVVMEGKSEKAFKALAKLSSQKRIRVVRDGEIKLVLSEELLVGDLVIIGQGDKIPADGRIIRSADLTCDESTLTGESKSVQKDGNIVLSEDTPLADRKNMVYSGTFVTAGTGAYVVTAVGEEAEIGKIARDVVRERSVSAPLEEKLSRLGKMVSIFGACASGIVFILSFLRLVLLNDLSFDTVQEIFIESIVLIVAAVPEGLPTTVAISLTLNVLRLAKSNALIKKLVATETVGSVSVICSDKTGTLTKNKMELLSFFGPDCRVVEVPPLIVRANFAVNTAATVYRERSALSYLGSGTEIALLSALEKFGDDPVKIQKSGPISPKTPFSSQIKYMETFQTVKGRKRIYLKGAPEVVLDKCDLNDERRTAIFKTVSAQQGAGGRVLAFAHDDGEGYVYDGFAVLGDGLRDDVKSSVRKCLDAGIGVKILTGDSRETASFIAGQLGLPCGDGAVITAGEVDGLSDGKLKALLPKITVIARSTPKTKLRVVTLLQQLGEVVAVTGDGVNDAPAIRHADIGICMGDGAEITKQASDVVLLDNSFSTILKAISFGRNVYSNFQRFISFQLTVNLSSMAIIIACLILGLESPFSSTCLLWLNVIMDGPLALSLGLERGRVDRLSGRPVKRSDDILSGKMLLRIGIHSLFICLAVCMQRLFNYLGCRDSEASTVTITLFVFFHVFNAVNCREVSSRSAIKGLLGNRLLLVMMAVTCIIHVLIVTLIPGFFETVRLPLWLWLKILGICFSIVVLSEGYKLAYRSIIAPLLTKNRGHLRKITNN